MERKGENHKKNKKIHAFFYKKILKPLLFRCNPENVHDAFTLLGKFLGSNPFGRACLRWAYHYHHPLLTQNILGLTFHNPVGLAAGFDKNIVLTNAISAIGFGFEEGGSITGESCKGNPKPRLWRLPKSQSLLVHYGLKNDGCEKIAKRLQGKKFTIPLGISIAKTNNATCTETEAGITDYEKAFRTLHSIGDYVTINISCPNAFGGEPFTSPEKLEQLLTRLDAIQTTKPIFVKLPIDITTHKLDGLVSILANHRVHGVIISNLTKQYDREEIDPEERKKILRGGLSGKPTREASNALISHLFQTTGKRFVIIGVGGISSAEDAYKKIRCGASLVQMITGMIFEGPQIVGEINRGLVDLLQRDGFSNIQEAIGTATQ